MKKKSYHKPETQSVFVPQRIMENWTVIQGRWAKPNIGNEDNSDSYNEDYDEDSTMDYHVGNYNPWEE